jgi:hypothetical protein
MWGGGKSSFDDKMFFELVTNWRAKREIWVSKSIFSNIIQHQVSFLVN